VPSVRELIAEQGPAALPLRRLLGALLDGAPPDIDALVAAHGIPRRTVEALLRAYRGDEHELRERPFPLPSLERVRAIVASAPPALRDLDHVPATAETLLRRAEHLATTYDLSQSRVLFLGDHDGTALALGAGTVVDIDQRVLDRSPDARFADLRVGLPRAARGAFDLVFTDPPYTPDGVGLFVARALEALRDPRTARILLAYGFPESQPALGLKVQRELSALELVTESVLPGFNAYDGAQAIGSRAALYTLRPTRRSVKLAARRAGRYAIYTHGRQSEESAPATPTDLSRLLAGEIAPETIDLRPYYARSLVQALLASRRETVTVLTDNNTPGLRSAREQDELRQLLAPLYTLDAIDRSVDGSRDTRLRLTRIAPNPPVDDLLDLPQCTLRKVLR
jgi:hypothetical protein